MPLTAVTVLPIAGVYFLQERVFQLLLEQCFIRLAHVGLFRILQMISVYEAPPFLCRCLISRMTQRVSSRRLTMVESRTDIEVRFCRIDDFLTIFMGIGFLLISSAMSWANLIISSVFIGFLRCCQRSFPMRSGQPKMEI